MFNAHPKKPSPAGAILQAMAKVWGGQIDLPCEGLPFALHYHHNLGVWIERIAPAPPFPMEEADESWF
jgi:hypothetical protein